MLLQTTTHAREVKAPTSIFRLSSSLCLAYGKLKPADLRAVTQLQIFHTRNSQHSLGISTQMRSMPWQQLSKTCGVMVSPWVLNSIRMLAVHPAEED